MAVICGNESQTSDGEKCSHGQVNIFSEAFEFWSRKIHWTRHSKLHDDTKLTQALLIISPINIWLQNGTMIHFKFHASFKFQALHYAPIQWFHECHIKIFSPSSTTWNWVLCGRKHQMTFIRRNCGCVYISCFPIFDAIIPK